MAAKKLSVRKSLALSFAQQYTNFVFAFVAIMIISRLLTPKEIGIFSVAMGLTTLANMLRTFGISDYLVQETNLNESIIRTSFTINLIFAWGLALILFAASWQIGAFFNDEGVGRVVRVQSGTFVLVPFGITAMALLKRDMAFGALFKINTTTGVFRSCLTVALAYAGFSYMSMAWASLASMLVMVLGCVVWGFEYRVRGFGLDGWRRVLPFGAKMTISDIAVQLGEQSTNIVVGKVLGLTDAGIFSRGYGPVNMFRDKVVTAIQAVAYPAFAADHRSANAAPQLFLRALVYLTGISWPFFTFAALMALPMIRIMFGDQWDAAIPLMRWLCGAAVVGTLTYQCNAFFAAIGRVGTATMVEIQYQVARVGLAVVAAFYSIEAVAASQVLVYAVATALYYRKTRIFEALAIGRCMRALWPSAIVTLLSCAVPTVIAFWPGFLARHLISGFALAVLGGGGGWLLGIISVNHPLLQEIGKVVSRARNHLGKL